jgi:hypothetical protein
MDETNLACHQAIAVATHNCHALRGGGSAGYPGLGGVYDARPLRYNGGHYWEDTLAEIGIACAFC